MHFTFDTQGKIAYILKPKKGVFITHLTYRLPGIGAAINAAHGASARRQCSTPERSGC